MASRILKSVKYERENTVSVTQQTQKKAVHRSNVPPAKEEGTLTYAPTKQKQKQADNADPSSDSLLKEAQAQVETMLKQAQLQVTNIQEEARKSGWEAGYSEAQQAAEQELNEILASIRQIAASAQKEKERFLNNSKENFGDLAVAIAEKIIGQQLSLNPNVVTEIVAQAIKGANITGACRIRVNPQDYEILAPSWDTIPSLQPSDKKWELISDDHVTRGGCIIEVDGGTLDAQIDTQLAQVKDSFEELKTGF